MMRHLGFIVSAKLRVIVLVYFATSSVLDIVSTKLYKMKIDELIQMYLTNKK